MLASVESESVVTTFYNMAGMKSIFFRAICFFAFEASPPPQKSISMIHFVPLFFGGVALHMITCPPPSMMEAKKKGAHATKKDKSAYIKNGLPARGKPCSFLEGYDSFLR